MAYLDTTLTQVYTPARGKSGRVTQRCHNSPRWETVLPSASDVTHRKRAEDFGNLKKVSSRVDTCLGRRRLAFAGSRRPCGRCRTRCRGAEDEKARRERMCISLPYVEERLNSKVIKSFLPELRCRYVFFVFRDSYVLSLWTFDVRFTHSHIMAMVQLNCFGFNERSSGLQDSEKCVDRTTIDV